MKSLNQPNNEVWREAIKILTNFIVVENDVGQLWTFISQSHELEEDENITIQLAIGLKKAQDPDILVEILEAIYDCLELDNTFEVDTED